MKLLSLFVCLAMMLSGGYMTDDPSAAAATQITIRDLVVEIQGEEYPLNPTATFSASTENGAALLDFFMTLDDQTLFPVQVKVDDAGAGVLLGNSTTAYTFTSEFWDEMMGGEEIPEDIFDSIDAVFSMMREALEMKDSDETDLAAMNYACYEKLAEIAENYQCEASTFFIDDVEHSGKHVTFELTHEQYNEWLEYQLSLYPAEYAEAYSRFLAITDSSAAELGTPYTEISISGDVSYNETSSMAFMDGHYEYVLDTEGLSEEEIAELQELYPAYDMQTTTVATGSDHEKVDILLDQEGMLLNASASIEGDNMTLYASAEALDVMNMWLDLSVNAQEDGSMQAPFSLGIDCYGSSVLIVGDSAVNEAGSVTDVEIHYNDEVFSAGATFSVDVNHDAIADRISGASVQTISSSAEMEESTAMTGLSLAAMSMMSDVEKLLNDESVAAFVPVAEQFLGYSATEADVVEETVAIADPPEDFPEPVINNIPEGFELTDSYYDGEYDCYSFMCFASDGSGREIYIDVYDQTGEDFCTYFSVSDGKAAPIDGNMISGYAVEDGGFVTAYGYVNGHYVDIYIYGSGTLTVEDAANIAAGISFAE